MYTLAHFARASALSATLGLRIQGVGASLAGARRYSNLLDGRDCSVELHRGRSALFSSQARTLSTRSPLSAASVGSEASEISLKTTPRKRGEYAGEHGRPRMQQEHKTPQSPLGSRHEEADAQGLTPSDYEFIKSIRRETALFRNRNPDNMPLDNMDPADSRVDVNVSPSTYLDAEAPEWIAKVAGILTNRTVLEQDKDNQVHQQKLPESVTSVDATRIGNDDTQTPTYTTLDAAVKDCFAEEDTQFDTQPSKPAAAGENINQRKVFDKVAMVELRTNSGDDNYGEFDELSDKLLKLPSFDVDSLENLTDSWLNQGKQSQDSLLLLTLSFVELGRIDKVMECLHKFKVHGVVPNAESLRHMIKVTAKLPNVDVNIILSLFDQLVLTNVTPSPMVFTALIRMFAIQGMKSEAERFFRLAAMEGHVFELSLQTAMLSAYAQVGCINDAIRVFQQIKQPDIVCINYVLFALSKHGKIQEIAQVIDFLRSNNSPTAVTPDVLGRRTGVVAKPTVYTYRCIISACVNRNDREVLEVYFKKMLEDNISPDGYMAYLLICVKTQDTSDFQYWVKFVFGPPDKPTNLTMTRHVFKNLVYLSFEHDQNLMQLDWLASYAIKRNIRLSFDEWCLLMWAYRIVGNTNAVKIIWKSIVDSTARTNEFSQDIMLQPTITDHFICSMALSMASAPASNIENVDLANEINSSGLIKSAGQGNWPWIRNELNSLFENRIGVRASFFDTLLSYIADDTTHLMAATRVYKLVIDNLVKILSESKKFHDNEVSSMSLKYLNGERIIESGSNKEIGVDLYKKTRIPSMDEITEVLSRDGADERKRKFQFMGDDSARIQIRSNKRSSNDNASNSPVDVNNHESNTYSGKSFDGNSSTNMAMQAMLMQKRRTATRSYDTVDTATRDILDIAAGVVTSAQDTFLQRILSPESATASSNNQLNIRSNRNNQRKKGKNGKGQPHVRHELPTSSSQRQQLIPSRDSSIITGDINLNQLVRGSSRPVKGVSALGLYANALTTVPIILSQLLIKAGIFVRDDTDESVNLLAYPSHTSSSQVVSNESNSVGKYSGKRSPGENALRRALHTSQSPEIALASGAMLVADDATVWVPFLAEIGKTGRIKSGSEPSTEDSKHGPSSQVHSRARANAEQRAAASAAAVLLDTLHRTRFVTRAALADPAVAQLVPRWVR